MKRSSNEDKRLAVKPTGAISPKGPSNASLSVEISRVEQRAARAQTIPEIKTVMAAVKALKELARDVNAKLEERNRLAEVHLNTERKLGERLVQIQNAKPGPKNNYVVGNDIIPGLKELGITRDLSSRSQELASVPKADFEAAIARQKDSGEEISTTATLRLLRARSKSEPKPPGKVISASAQALWRQAKAELGKMPPDNASAELALRKLGSLCQDCFDDKADDEFPPPRKKPYLPTPENEGLTAPIVDVFDKLYLKEHKKTRYWVMDAVQNISKCRSLTLSDAAVWLLKRTKRRAAAYEDKIKDDDNLIGGFARHYGTSTLITPAPSSATSGVKVARFSISSMRCRRCSLSFSMLASMSLSIDSRRPDACIVSSRFWSLDLRRSKWRFAWAIFT